MGHPEGDGAGVQAPDVRAEHPDVFVVGYVADYYRLFSNRVLLFVVRDISLGQEHAVYVLVALSQADQRLTRLFSTQSKHESPRTVQDTAVAQDNFGSSQHTVDLVDVVGDLSISNEGAFDIFEGELLKHLFAELWRTYPLPMKLLSQVKTCKLLPRTFLSLDSMDLMDLE